MLLVLLHHIKYLPSRFTVNIVYVWF